MSQNINILSTINAVEGFNPEDYAVDYTDLNSKETRKRLPVIAQIAWFRLKYPLGKISLRTEQKGNIFVATARIHPDYKDPVDVSCRGNRIKSQVRRYPICKPQRIGPDGSYRNRAPQRRLWLAVRNGVNMPRRRPRKTPNKNRG